MKQQPYLGVNMRVFVTGASGYIGNGVACAFRRAGHHVTGLVRSEKGADLLRRQEIVPVIGEMENPSSYLMLAEKAEVLVHCASDSSSNRVQHDWNTIENLIKAARSAPLPRTIIYTSGCWIYGNTHGSVVDEASPVNPLEIVKWRPKHEELVLQAESRHLRTLVIRPGCVYGGAGLLTSLLFAGAKKGAVSIVGDGKNHWSMVHIEDLARAYVLAAEKEISGVVLNVNDGTHLRLGEIAEKIAEHARIPGKVRNLSLKDAIKLYGHAAEGMHADQKISNERARRLLGWAPAHANFLDALPLYFASWQP